MQSEMFVSYLSYSSDPSLSLGRFLPFLASPSMFTTDNYLLYGHKSTRAMIVCWAGINDRA